MSLNEGVNKIIKINKKTLRGVKGVIKNSTFGLLKLDRKTSSLYHGEWKENGEPSVMIRPGKTGTFYAENLIKPKLGVNGKINYQLILPDTHNQVLCTINFYNPYLSFKKIKVNLKTNKYNHFSPVSTHTSFEGKNPLNIELEIITDKYLINGNILMLKLNKKSELSAVFNPNISGDDYVLGLFGLADNSEHWELTYNEVVNIYVKKNIKIEPNTKNSNYGSLKIGKYINLSYDKKIYPIPKILEENILSLMYFSLTGNN